MASKIIGRKACPECGFGAAHIKQSEKCVYRYCPECGATYYAKGEAAAQRLTAGMRPEGAAPAPSVPTGSGSGAPVAPAPAPEAKPTATTTTTTTAPPERKRSALFGL